MPSVKEIYRKITDVTIDADSINLNTDTLESLLSTAQADIAEIKDKAILNDGVVQTDVTGGYISGVKDGDGNTFGIDRNFPVEVVNNYPVPVSGTFWQETQPVSGSVSVLSGQGSAVTLSSFTSTTASTSLVSASSNRKVITVYNEGSGVLNISAGSTCTTTSYQVRLASGDYWECPSAQTSLAHTAVFITAGTARVTQIS
jgi:hypothetical protein